MKKFNVSYDVIARVRRRREWVARQRRATTKMLTQPITRHHYDRAIQRMESNSTVIPAVPNDSSITLTDPCKVWNGRNKCGYGYTSVRGRGMAVHRISVIVHHNNYDSIPGDKVVRHLCRSKACWNPKHLLIGSREENGADAVKAGKVFTKLTEEQVKEIYLKRDVSPSILAQQYAVSYRSILRIQKGERWGFLTKDM